MSWINSKEENRLWISSKGMFIDLDTTSLKKRFDEASQLGSKISKKLGLTENQIIEMVLDSNSK